METVKKYFPWIVTALAVVAMAVAVMFTNNVRETSEQRIQHVSDSLYQVMYTDSLAYENEIYRLDSLYSVSQTKVESLSTAVQVKKSDQKVYIKTVYKDSVREVYVDNSEVLVDYQNSIKRLQDSLAVVNVSRVDTFVKYVEKIVHDTIVQAIHTDDTVTVETSVKPSKTFAIYADGTFVYDIGDGPGYNAEAGGKWFFKGPLYVKGAVKYDGSLGIAAGIGGELSF